MRLLIFLVSIIAFVQSLQPGARISLNTSLYIQLKQYLLPLIDRRLSNVTLQNYSKKVPPLFEVNFTNAHFDMSPIISSLVQLKFANLSSKTEINVTEMEGVAGFDIYYELAKFRDHIHCDAYLKHMYIISTISNAINDSGAPDVKVSAKLNVEPLKAQLIFTGGTTAKLLELVEPIIRVFLLESIDIGINQELYKWIAHEMNAFLSSFKYHISLTDQITLDYELPFIATYFNESITVPLSGYAYYLHKKFPPPFDPPSIPIYDTSFDKNAHFFMSDYMLNSILKICFDNNILLLNLSYDTISPFHMNLSCNASNSPNLTIGDYIFTNFSFFCNVSALNTTDQTVTLFNTYGSLGFYINYIFYKYSIQFDISQTMIRELNFIKPAEFDVDWFINHSKEIANTISGMINDGFLRVGVPFPYLKNIDYAVNMQTKLYPHIIGIFTDVWMMF